MSNVIEGFEQLTQDQVIDISVRHVLKNGQPSRDPCSGNCTYRGIGCAAAPFLADAAKHTMTGLWDYLIRYEHVPNTNAETIIKLQRSHDYAAYLKGDEFIKQFKANVRHKFGNVPALNQENTP